MGGPWEDYTTPDVAVPVQEPGPWQDFATPAGAQILRGGVLDKLELDEFDHTAMAERVAHGSMINRVFTGLWDVVEKGAQTDVPLGIAPGGEVDQWLTKYGVFRDPKQGRFGDTIRLANEAMIKPSAQLFDLVGRVFSVGTTAGGELAGQLTEAFGGSQGEAERARRDVKGFLDTALLLAGSEAPAPFSRVTRGPGGALIDDPIGGLPKRADFDAATTGVRQMTPDAPVSPGVLEGKVKALYEEHGIHPAEVVADASRNPELARDLASNSPMLPKHYTGFDPLEAAKAQIETELAAGAKKPKAPDGVSVSLNEALQERLAWPEAPTGVTTSATTSMRFGDWVSRSIDRIGLGDVSRDLQMKITPMAVRDASVDARASAKDFANALRVSRYDWTRLHSQLSTAFKPEQLARMWDAADIDNVALLTGKPASAVAKLPDAERYTVQALQARAAEAWADAKLAGVVSPDAHGLPSYVPRMIVSDLARNGEMGGYKPFSNPQGRNVNTTTAQLKRRQHLTAEETLAAARQSLGEDAELVRDIRTLPMVTAKLQEAIAGRKLINRIRALSDVQDEGVIATVLENGVPSGDAAKYFTVDHPAFTTWKPRLERRPDGKFGVVLKDDGTPVFDKVPLHVRRDFEGPLRAVLQPKPDGRIYSALMELKSKSMSLIMYSPLLHNAVIFGRMFPAMALKTTWKNPAPYFRVYFDGAKAKRDADLMREAIANGMTPMGGRGVSADLHSIVEAPTLEPGRSITSKIAAYIPGLFDPVAGVAVKRAVDQAGDFWHNTLLWDRIGDLQAGLYKSYLEEMLAKGTDRVTASRFAAHLANRYAGVLPIEAMSTNARKFANVLLFSRSFTLGNIGAMKDMFVGLPREVLAQIERDGGLADMMKVRSYAQRKAIGIVVADMALFYAGNSLLQSGLSLLRGDSDLNAEAQGYVDRLVKWAEEVPHNPFEVFALPHAITPNAENEPGRAERILVGYHSDGTAIYARNPTGKVGEEMIGYLTMPTEMLKRKLSPTVKPAMDIFNNRDTLGRMVYNPYVETPAEYLENAARIAGHFMAAHVPYDALEATVDLLFGDPTEKDKIVDVTRIVGPLIGITFSKGAPGGPAVGEYYQWKRENEFKVQQNLPLAKKAIERGNVDEARRLMDEAKMPLGLQRYYIQTAEDPRTRTARRAFLQFLETLDPAERDRVKQLIERSQPVD